MNCVENAEASLHTDLPLQEYVYDPFEEIDASSTVTSWKDIKCVCSRVEFDGVSKDLLKMLSLLFQRCYNVYEAYPSFY